MAAQSTVKKIYVTCKTGWLYKAKYVTEIHVVVMVITIPR
jgi:hypothetical protein